MIRFGLHLAAVSLFALSAVRGTEPGMAAFQTLTAHFFEARKKQKNSASRHSSSTCGR
jgi:hypothetical protein